MDYELSRLQRLASTGDPDAASKLLSMRVRAGLNPHYVRQAAALGDPAALSLFKPAPPTNVYCNYTMGSIGFNGVDGVLGGINVVEDLVSIAISFVRHAIDQYVRSLPCVIASRKPIENFLKLADQWTVISREYREHLEELLSSLSSPEPWPYSGPDREEVYSRYYNSPIKQELLSLNQQIAILYDLLRNLDLPDSESEIRWATVHIGRIMLEKYRPQLDAVWVAEYCRRVAWSFSEAEAYQRQELEWQRQFLIRWLLQ